MYLLHQKWHCIVLLVFLCFQFPKDGISQTFQYKIRVDEVDMQAPSSMPDGKIK
ncbi:MAG: hypothetical protein RIR11_1220, partial [Bacteroidota bacterium]